MHTPAQQAADRLRAELAGRLQAGLADGLLTGLPGAFHASEQLQRRQTLPTQLPYIPRTPVECHL